MQPDPHDPLAAVLLLALLFSAPRTDTATAPAERPKKRAAPLAMAPSHLKRAANYGGTGPSWRGRP